jgi:hypothetical protein
MIESSFILQIERRRWRWNKEKVRSKITRYCSGQSSHWTVMESTKKCQSSDFRLLQDHAEAYMPCDRHNAEGQRYDSFRTALVDIQ